MKTFILILFLYFSKTEASLNPIFEVAAKLESLRCYQSVEGSVRVELVTCDNKCYIRTTEDGVTTKGCLSIDLDDNFCNASDKECTLCEGDLCNSELEDLGVTKCYVCLDECPEEPAQHDCPEVLTEREGRPVKAACLSYELRNTDGITTLKGCVPDNDHVRETCSVSNAAVPGVECSMCYTDLCNAEEIPEPSYVEECYYCQNNCSETLAIQKCGDVLEEGADSRCIALEYGEESYKGCVGYNSTVQLYCSLANMQGGNCTICDTDLCNADVIPQPTGVDECYYCQNNCSEALAIQKCKDVLEEGADSRCIAIEYGEESYKGCVGYNSTVQLYCSLANMQGGNCTICDTNLCNAQSELPETGVEKCYFCDRVCKDPLEIHDCREQLGENVKGQCVAIEFEEDGTTFVSRRCEEINDNFLATCNNINNAAGGNCTICNTELCNGPHIDDDDGESDSEKISAMLSTIVFLIFCTIYL